MQIRKLFCQPVIEHTDFPSLTGKSVLIVGGTHGMGEALARRCLLLGASVTVIGKTNNPTLNCDQVLIDVVEQIEAVEPYFIGKDYVFNNLGIYEKNTIVGTSRDRLQEVLKTNIEIMYLLAKYAIKHIREVVVNMSSRPTLEKYHSWSLYTLSKQAIITITQASAEEGTQKHYAICPSRVDTKFREAVFPGEDRSTRLTPDEIATFILQLFNGKNPSGSHYWVKAI